MASVPLSLRRLRSGGPDLKGKRGIAFIVEALILLFFLALSIAVFVQLLGGATLRGQKAVELEDAVQIAEDAAEQFAANPTSLPSEDRKGVYNVNIEVTPQASSTGILYTATISVSKDGYKEPIYELESARYVDSTRRPAPSTPSAPQGVGEGTQDGAAQEGAASAGMPEEGGERHG